jgi:hypothetical protein
MHQKKDMLVIEANVKLQTKKSRRMKDVPPHLYLKIMANDAAAKPPHHPTAIQLGYGYAGELASHTTVSGMRHEALA